MINAALNSWHMQVPDQLKRFVFLSEWTTVNPLLRPTPPPPLSPTGGLFISSTFEGGGLIETGGLVEKGELIQFSKDYQYSIKDRNSKWKS